jgi:hypothetical protein
MGIQKTVKKCECCKKESTEVEYRSYHGLNLCYACDEGFTQAEKRAEANHP